MSAQAPIEDRTLPRFMYGKKPGVNIDRVDVNAGLRQLEALGWSPDDDPRTFMVIQYALQRWARGEEEQAERLAIAHGETSPAFIAAAITLTSWRVVLACAIAAAETAVGDES